MGDQREVYHFREDHYRVAMEAAGIGMWDWDLLSNRQIWSKECKAILGIPQNCKESFELFISLIYPEDQERIHSLLVESHRTGAQHSIEYRIIWPDGSLHWIADRGKHLYDADGKAIRLVGIVIDITAQKRLQEAQQEAERHIREILESVSEAFSHVDREWHFTYVNSRAEHVGRAIVEEEMLGKTLWEIYPELIGTSIERHFRQVMETRQPVAFEAYYPEGQRWYDIHSYPARTGGITNFHTDITERKALEHERNLLLEKEREARREAEAAREQREQLIKQLERERAFLRTLMKQAPAGMIIAEAPTGKIIDSNEEASNLLGYVLPLSKDYTEYRSHGALHADETPYCAEEYPLARTILTGEMISQEDMLYRHGDGHLLHLSVSSVPIWDAQGNMLAGIATFHDISERYELERKKDEFICLASHELRTPLTSLKGNLQLTERRLQRLLNDARNVFAQEERASLDYLILWNERALRQVNVVNRLVNDLLDARYIRMEGLRISLIASDLVQIVRNAVDDMQAGIQTHTIQFDLSDIPELLVMVDGMRIGQVVTNYLENALKYSAERQPVTIGIAVEGKEARVWVRDTGPGLSQEAQRHIWDRFRRVSGFMEYTGSGSSGLGLGLYICQELIRLHGGQVGVESVASEGSTFWFTLPLVD